MRLVFYFLLMSTTSYQVAYAGLPDFPAPKFIDMQFIGENALANNGYTVKSYNFYSAKPNKSILKFYKNLWGDIKTLETSRWYYHSYFDGQYLFTIQVKKTTNKYTRGIAGVSEPDLKRNKIKLEGFYPINLGVKMLSDTSSVDFGKSSRTSVFDSSGTALSNLNRYKRHFERKGWAEVKAKLANKMIMKFGAGSLIMQKGSDELVLSFIPEKNGRTKIVGVYVDK